MPFLADDDTKLIIEYSMVIDQFSLVSTKEHLTNEYDY
jgi:hypothetical protein